MSEEISKVANALNNVSLDYAFHLDDKGAMFTLPLDPTEPRVPIYTDELVSDHLIGRVMDEFNVAPTAQLPKAVEVWLQGNKRRLTRGATPAKPALRAVQVDDSDGTPRLFIDLGDRLVGYYLEVFAGGWRLVDPRRPDAEDTHPIDSRPIFRRGENFGALPIPRHGDTRGTGKAWLRDALNLDDERDWMVVWGWLMSVWFTEWDRVGLLMEGISKRGKTLRTETLLSLIHPGSSVGASFPTDVEDWGTHVENLPVLAFDDVSHISDAAYGNLKRVVTGTSFRSRTKYKNREMTETSGKRPIILNANGMPTGLKEDLRNRLRVVHINKLPGVKRLKRELVQHASAIMADLLDDISDALVHYLDTEEEVDDEILAGKAIRPREVTAFLRAADRAQQFAPEDGYAAANDEALNVILQEASDRMTRTIMVALSNQPRDTLELSNQDLYDALRRAAEELYPDDRLDGSHWFPQDAERMSAFINRRADSLDSLGFRIHPPDKLNKYTRGRRWDPIADEDRVSVQNTAISLAIKNSAGALAGPTLQEDE
jgi:hypothetical protein